jgi:predicted CXXCH cytochrome family protein
MDCHNLMVSGVSDHPWDVQISGSWYADWTRWSEPIENRVPSENPTGNPAPDPGDRVFCLSCHKAHGSPNYGALIYADGATLDSTCQQCHNQ